MADRLARLREIAAAARSSPRPVSVRVDAAALAETDVADALGGRWIRTGEGCCLLVERLYRPDRQYGDSRIGSWRVSGREAFDWLSAAPEEQRTTERDAVVFLDLETTGLSGGAGMCAFLVGCAFFDGDGFRVQQFFLPAPAHERGFLTILADSLRAADRLVTFNGKSFDLPTMELRWQFHRLSAPLGGRPHLDLLHPARRFWRRRSDEPVAGDGQTAGWSRDRRKKGLRSGPGPESCTLVALERALLGVDRGEDVPGFEIPARYFHFVRSGDAAPLEAVFEHNRFDLLSLAGLTDRAMTLVEEGLRAAQYRQECVALGRLYDRRGMRDRAIECYRRATDEPTRGALPPDPEAEREGLRRLAMLLRRERRYDDASTVWQRLAGRADVPDALRHEAFEALAVHREHRVRDLHGARELAISALQTPLVRPSRRRMSELRLSRLDRKLAVHAKGGTLAAFLPI